MMIWADQQLCAQTTQPVRTLFARQLDRDTSLRIVVERIPAAFDKFMAEPAAPGAPRGCVSAVMEKEGESSLTIWNQFFDKLPTELECLDAKIAQGQLVVALYSGGSIMLFRQPLTMDAAFATIRQGKPTMTELLENYWTITAFPGWTPTDGKAKPFPSVPGTVTATLSVDGAGAWVVDVINRVGKAAGQTRFVQVDSKWEFSNPSGPKPVK